MKNHLPLILLGAILQFFPTATPLARAQGADNPGAPYLEEMWFFKAAKEAGGNFTQIPDANCATSFHFIPTIGDVDHDAVPDVVFLWCNHVNVVKDIGFDGELAQIIWRDRITYSSPQPSTHPPTVEVADIDQDGLNEIIVPVEGGINVYQPWDANGVLADNPLDWAFRFPEGDETAITRFAVGDVNNDTFPDIVAVYARFWGVPGDIFAIGGLERGIIWKVPTSGNGNNMIDPPTLFDMDRDGFLDVVAQYGNKIDVWKVYDQNPGFQPTRIMEWQGPEGLRVQLDRTLAIADINQDARPDIVTSINDNSALLSRVFALTVENGQLRELWTDIFKSTSDLSPVSPSLGDIDHDGRSIETVISNRVGTDIYNAEGNIVWHTERGNSASAPALGDFDDDGDLEFVIGSGDDPHKILIFDPVLDPPGHFEPVYEFAFEATSAHASSSPLLGDMDGDGTLDIVYNHVYNDLPITVFGTLNALRINFSKVAPGEAIWPTLEANTHKTNLGVHGRLDSSSVTFKRGDVDTNEGVDVRDVVYILNYLFSGGPPPECLDAADADDNGELSITDAIYIINYLLLIGDAPAAPGPHDPGPDPTPDALECR